jgi:uncharacterized protein (TIGR03435 family)
VEFEVASVKLTEHGRTADGSSHSSINSGPGSFKATNVSLQMLLTQAYDLKDYQVAGPDWINSDGTRYDIAAKMPAGASSPQMPAMLQALLAQRWKLISHRETRTLPIYTMIVAKDGLKMHRAPADGNSKINTTNGRMTAQHVSMADLADQLSGQLGRAVIDRTGLAGAFDFTLNYSTDDTDATRPSLFTALEEQTGLKLEAAKGPIEVLVVDRAERVPSEN